MIATYSVPVPLHQRVVDAGENLRGGYAILAMTAADLAILAHDSDRADVAAAALDARRLALEVHELAARLGGAR